ncbi:NAD(P)H-binding protein [Microlunatus flavus]|uniref:NAD(P)H-binding protein n=1 Tax=Microlunatus flavus TaxID=1036181 RepID=UPI00147B9BE5|nr:NAD(P)H-binding protein [Microlunatus flavus]
MTGSTGNVGRELVPLLVQRDLDVRCLVHAGGVALRTADAEVVEGDVDDPASVAAALEGCDRLFLLTPAHPDQVRRESALVDAAVRAGVRHVVAVSVVGADAASPSTFARWHREVDEHLRASGLGVTLLRPTAFMQVHLVPPGGAADGRWYGASGDGAHAFVDARDVADVAAHVLASSHPVEGALEVTGPRAITVPEAARAYGQAFGREVAYVDLPPEQLAGAMRGNGVPGFLVEGIVELYAAIRAGHAATTSNGVEELTGRPPGSYEDFLDRVTGSSTP